MKVTVVSPSKGMLYHQEFDDSKEFPRITAHLMQQPSGTSLETVLENNGHSLVFKTAQFELKPLVLAANGSAPRASRAKAEVIEQ